MRPGSPTCWGSPRREGSGFDGGGWSERTGRGQKHGGGWLAEARRELLELACEDHGVEPHGGEGRAPLDVAARRGLVGGEDARAFAARADAGDGVADRRLDFGVGLL